MTIENLLHAVSCFLVCVAICTCGFGGTAASTGLSEPVRFAVAGCLVAGTFVFATRLLFVPVHRAVLTIAVGAAWMAVAQYVALTYSAPSRTVDFSVLNSHMIQQVCLGGWILFCLQCDWRRKSLRVSILAVGYIVLLASYILWFREGMPIPFVGWTTGKNALAAFCTNICFWGLFGAFAARTNREWWFGSLLAGLAVLLLVISGGRSNMLLVFVGFLTYCLVLKGGGFRPLAWGILGAVAMFSVLLPVYFVQLDQYSVVQWIDRYMMTYTHSIYSGREDLWPRIMASISEHPFSGHGTEVSWRFTRAAHGIEKDLSAHNLWLAILYQTGILGLSGCLSLIFCVWHALTDRKVTVFLALSIAWFTGVLVRESLEVSLFQNTLQIGLGSWAAVMAGLGWSIQSEMNSVRVLTSFPNEPEVVAAGLSMNTESE